MTNIEIDKGVVWRAIKTRFNSVMLGRWNTYCNDQWQKEKEQYAHLNPPKSMIEIDEERIKYVQSLQTLNGLKKYFIKAFHIKPDIAYWLKQLSYFRYLRNEDPVEVYQKLQRYMDEINAIALDLAEVYGERVLRRLTRIERCENEKRVFVIENNKIENENDSTFNRKVKNKLSRIYDKNSNINGSDLRDALEIIKEDILPQLAQNTNDPSAQSWISYHKEPHLSLLKPPRSNRETKNPKQKRYNDRKSDPNTKSDRKTPCPNRRNCKYLQSLRTGGKC
ncbi:MAG: hypothetical protein GY928_07390, partial [Colwellia sp.]|nr:hypothetical protein [Colwellia sp.]